MQELRCDNGIKAGELRGKFLEVPCQSRRCGKEPGVVIIHRYRLNFGPEGQLTGELVGTLKHKSYTGRGTRDAAR